MCLSRHKSRDRLLLKCKNAVSCDGQVQRRAIWRSLTERDKLSSLLPIFILEKKKKNVLYSLGRPREHLVSCPASSSSSHSLMMIVIVPRRPNRSLALFSFLSSPLQNIYLSQHNPFLGKESHEMSHFSNIFARAIRTRYLATRRASTTTGLDHFTQNGFPAKLRNRDETAF